MKISVLINSRNRIEPLTRCLASVLAQDYSDFEVVVLDDASDRYHLAPLLAARFKTNRLRCLRVDTPLGVAGSRNRLMQQATGDIFCFIDDDAMFTSSNALLQIEAAFQQRPRIGIIALKIENHGANAKSLNVPFSRRCLRKNPELVNLSQPVSYFLGTGHAIVRKVLVSCGGYQPNLVFGEEELDLSYRVVEAGFEIYYLPQVVIHHYPQPSVVQNKAYRQPELYHHVRNRFFLAYKYLPWVYIPIYLAIWLSRYGGQAAKTGALREFGGGIISGFNLLAGLQRNPLGAASLRYLKAYHGRLWY